MVSGAVRLGVTLERFIAEEQRSFSEARGQFTGLLYQIALAGKLISREVAMAGLAEDFGLTGKINVQGEEVQKLDEYAQRTFVRCLDHSGYLCIMASEEEADVIEIPLHYPAGDYALAFDPLDGSSNIDVNVNIGSIFSITRKRSSQDRGTLEDILQPGAEQIGAGYLVYGSSTMLVYTTGKGVNGFTLDPSLGEFLLSHPNIEIPERGRIYSINEGNSATWDDATARYVAHVKQNDPGSGRPYSGRYIGSLVADFHRNLLKGGIFLYPADAKKRSGKLRLLYEANPLAMIVEQAGGMASDGTRRILDIVPQSLHQRTPLIIGSRGDVEEALSFYQGKA